jgi:hypothetical protein
VNVANRANFASNRESWINNQHVTGNSVRANAGNRYANAYRSGNYRQGVVGGYQYQGGWGSQGPYYGWRPATYAALGNFMGAGSISAEPAYYGYGDGGNAYYQDDQVYVDGQSVGTAEQYTNQAAALVSAAPPPEKVAQEEWLPLGAFAFAREDADDSQCMIELAINKQGVVAGTYYNEATGVSRALKGTVDRKSGRAAVGFADGKNADLVLETGIYNLTQDEAPCLLHFGTSESSPALLVRLQPPAKSTEGQ